MKIKIEWYVRNPYIPLNMMLLKEKSKRHLKNIYQDGELALNATVAKKTTVQIIEDML